jgi:hypothetical protein
MGIEMKYIVIDNEYCIYKTDVLTGKLRSKCKQGDISIIQVSSLKGMNLDGTWSDINEWDGNHDD